MFVGHRAQTHTCFGEPFKNQRIRSIHDEFHLRLNKGRKTDNLEYFSYLTIIRTYLDRKFFCKLAQLIYSPSIAFITTSANKNQFNSLVIVPRVLRMYIEESMKYT